MQYLGTFDVANANSGKNGYANNKLYFQTWLTELQAHMEKHESFKHLVIHGVHPGYVKTNIWVRATNTSPISWFGWALGALLSCVGIDAQQGSLAITNAATAGEIAAQQQRGDAEERAERGAKYFNRIWEEIPMPQTSHPGCRQQVWELVCKELKLEEKGLLSDLGV